MENVKNRSKKTYSTLKVFLICFAIYFICNTYSK